MELTIAFIVGLVVGVFVGSGRVLHNITRRKNFRWGNIRYIVKEVE